MGNHFKNLPSNGTTVTLLDRQGTKVHDALVVSRVKRGGKLRLAFVARVRGKTNRIQYVVAVPNASDWAIDKTVRFRWAYNDNTLPKYTGETKAPERKTQPFISGVSENNAPRSEA